MKSRQENQLKVRNFLPPQTANPEIYILDQEGGGGAGGGLFGSEFTGGPGRRLVAGGLL